MSEQNPNPQPSNPNAPDPNAPDPNAPDRSAPDKHVSQPQASTQSDPVRPDPLSETFAADSATSSATPVPPTSPSGSLPPAADPSPDAAGGADPYAASPQPATQSAAAEKVKQFEAQASKTVDQAVSKAGELAHENRDKVSQWLDKAGAAVDSKTDGKYASQVSKAKGAARGWLDKLAQKRPDK